MPKASHFLNIYFDDVNVSTDVKTTQLYSLWLEMLTKDLKEIQSMAKRVAGLSIEI